MWRIPLCSYCKYLNNNSPTCPAYPEKIPHKVMFGGQLHTELVGDETEPVCFAIASDEDPKEVKKFFGIEV